VTKLAVAEFELTVLVEEDLQALGSAVYGNEDLDEFVRKDAFGLGLDHVTTTYVARHPSELGAIFGYVSLVTDCVRLQPAEREGMGLTTEFEVIPAVKIARLACRQGRVKENTGTAMVRYAYLGAVRISNIAAARLLTVDAKAESVEFYEKLGFVRNEKSPGARARETVSMRLDLFGPAEPSWL